jgi:hypothetical protein
MIVRQGFKFVAAGLVLCLAPLAAVRVDAGQTAQKTSAQAPDAASRKQLLDTYCVTCHSERRKATAGNFTLEKIDTTAIGENAAVWEKVVRKLSGGLMPPPGNKRPDKATYEAFRAGLEKDLDAYAAAHPNPGRTEAFHRLNRTEYANIVRDLLGLDMDFTDLLPIDDGGGGEASFDNIANALRLNQALLETYLSVALKVARTAIGGTPPPAELLFRSRRGARQDVHQEGMPFGTKGGVLMEHIFPVDGEYEFEIAASGRGELDFSVDGERVKLIDVKPAPRPTDYDADAGVSPMAPPRAEGLLFTMPVKAGPHTITAAYIKTSATVKIEGDRTPYYGGSGLTGMGGGGGAVTEITLRGPKKVLGRGDSPSRAKIFTCRPASAATEDACAKTILTGLARRAYRRPLTAHDTNVLMTQYKEGKAAGDFETGVERGIRTMLVNPNFLLRVETDPAKVPPSGVYRISDLELASRLSFFLWSSIPDDQLLDVAIAGRLKDPLVLEKQVRRMLADRRSSSLTESFASQWLWIRNLKASMPSEPIFPNFDEGLREAFRTELEMFFDSVVKEDRSVIDLLDANYTFLNERLAKHYGIKGVYGTDFRRVQLPPEESMRRGLLGKGLLLLVTSRSTRTSPVVRGKWIMENVLGTPPPAPPANVPPLGEQKQSDGRVLTVRELMAKHRANPVCASCHATIDPLGFSLEQFDGVGKFRKVDTGFQPIDASGQLPDGTKFANIEEFRSLLLSKKDQFVTTMTNKLMMYALGRGTEHYDSPAIRRIVRDAAASNYKLSSIVLGIVKSAPFQMRKVGAATPATQSASLAR